MSGMELEQSRFLPPERSVTLLGATGSIGASTVDLLKRQRERYRVEAVTAYSSASALAALARDLGARFAAVGDPSAYAELKEALAGTGIAAGGGESALIEAALRPAEWVIGAIAGAAGLKPTLAAAERGSIVALANKETLVCAGDLFMRRAAASGATVLPVDSEHNALFQAMSGSRRRGCAPRHSDRLWRPVSHCECGGDQDRHCRAGAQASQLVDGPEGDGRFRNPDEQRTGTY